MAKKKKRKKTNNTILLYLMIVTVVVLFWVNHNSKKVQVLYPEEYTRKIEADALVIKNETVVNLKDKIDFSIKEGERVPIGKVLSDSRNITFSEYYNREIDMINWLLENEAYRDKNVFEKDIADIDKQIEEIEKNINWASNFSDDEKIKILKKDENELLKKKSYIIKSFQYIGVDKKTLTTLKQEYSNMKDSTGSSITLKKLNFNFPGYIFFNQDGYENLLNTNILGYLTPEYIKNIDKYNKNDYDEYGQTIRVVDDTYMYLGIVIPKNVVLSQEKRCLERKDEIMKTLKTDVLNEYYTYLNRRIDVLKTLPTIKYEYDKTKNSGFIIDIREYGEEKMIILELKDDMTKTLLTKRNIKINVITYAQDGYRIPEKSIVKVQGKDNIIIMSKGYLKKYLPVNITNREEDNVFLETSENKNITDGMQLILNP